MFGVNLTTATAKLSSVILLAIVLVGCSGYGCGTVFELSPQANGNWAVAVLYAFTGGNDGGFPFSGVIADKAGNLYGTTTAWGGYYNGTVYQLALSQSGWTEKTLYNFEDGYQGESPVGGLIFDATGSLYGTASYGGSDYAGAVFEMVPHPDDNWTYTMLYGFDLTGVESPPGPFGSLVMDTAGSLYGMTHADGVYGCGSVFKLSPSSGGWTYTTLHDFTGGYDGKWPDGNVVLGANGKIYGTTSDGGVNGYWGVVWEITP